MISRKTDAAWKKEFSARLRNRMEYLGIKQCDLAKMAEVSTSEVSKCVRGEYIPRTDIVVRFAIALAMTTDELINFKV